MDYFNFCSYNSAAKESDGFRDGWIQDLSPGCQNSDSLRGLSLDFPSDVSGVKEQAGPPRGRMAASNPRKKDFFSPKSDLAWNCPSPPLEPSPWPPVGLNSPADPPNGWDARPLRAGAGSSPRRKVRFQPQRRLGRGPAGTRLDLVAPLRPSGLKAHCFTSPVSASLEFPALCLHSRG